LSEHINWKRTIREMARRAKAEDHLKNKTAKLEAAERDARDAAINARHERSVNDAHRRALMLQVKPFGRTATVYGKTAGLASRDDTGAWVFEPYVLDYSEHEVEIVDDFVDRHRFGRRKYYLVVRSGDDHYAVDPGECQIVPHELA
jgi:hypothetical protein